jgi:hypothetical protein
MSRWMTRNSASLHRPLSNAEIAEIAEDLILKIQSELCVLCDLCV